MIKETDFSKALSSFLTEYLPGQRNSSINTIKSYRDVLKQMIYFMKLYLNISPEKITFSDINKDFIIEFLNWLENEKQISINTRNQRLAAIHSFFRYAQSEYPEILNISQRILGIVTKKCPQSTIQHLEKDCIEKLLKEPNQKYNKGLRDCTMLSVLYDGGLRVQELIDLKSIDLRITSPATMKIYGKGKKIRIVPITTNTKKLLQIYMEKNNLLDSSKSSFPLFFNSRYEKFTRPGVSYILRKYYGLAKEKYPDLPWSETISPHILRHSKAVHMLDAGIPLIYIRDFLGHVNITTTEIYLQSDRKIKRELLEKSYISTNAEEIPSWSENKTLLDWLDNICKE